MPSIRLYIGGLSGSISTSDLESLFQKVGAVSDISIHTKNKSIFGYLNLDATEENVKKYCGLLNGTKWKGGVLKIQEAKADYTVRLAQERPSTVKETPVVVKKNVLYRDIRFEKRDGWTLKDGYYVCKFKTRIRNRMKIVDPTRLRNHIRMKENDDEPSVLDLHFVVDDSPEALTSIGLIPTSETFRKKCGMFKNEELQLAKQETEKLKQQRLEYEQQLKQSQKSKKSFEREWNMKQEIKEEIGLQESVMERISGASVRPKGSYVEQGVVVFTDDDEPAATMDIDLSMFDSD